MGQLPKFNTENEDLTSSRIRINHLFRFQCTREKCFRYIKLDCLKMESIPFWGSIEILYNTFLSPFYKKIAIQIIFTTWKRKKIWRKWSKNIVFKSICTFCFNYVISMLWGIFWGAVHVCRSKIDDVENSFHIRHIFESPQPRGCSWRGYATQEADQELKWKLRTISVWENWVLEFLGSQSWDTRGGSGQTPPRPLQYLKKPAPNRVNRQKMFFRPFYKISLFIKICIIYLINCAQINLIKVEQWVHHDKQKSAQIKSLLMM